MNISGKNFNFTPGVTCILLALSLVAISFWMGISFIPFGAAALFATAYAAHLIFKQRSNAPGYAALFGSMVLNAAGLVLVGIS